MKRTALLDMDSIIFACFNGNKIPDGKGGWLRTEDNKRFLYTEKTPEEVIQACDDILTMILTDCGADSYILFIKGKDTIKDRLAVNPEYKQDRNQEQPKYWKLCSDHFVNKWGAHLANGLETDDCLNICKHNVPNSFLCCIDSDLLGTEGTHYDWKKKLWITSTKKNEEYRLWTDMIVGTHNNVKGLPKKGKVFAEKVLNGEGMLQPSTSSFPARVLNAYIEYYGNSHDAITEFYKNYKCVKLLTFKEDFGVPTPIEFKPVEKMTIQFTEEITPDPSTLKPNDDILSDTWFESIKPQEDLPEFDF